VVLLDLLDAGVPKKTNIVCHGEPSG